MPSHRAVVSPDTGEGFPSDVRIELALASASAVEYQGLPYDPVARRLFGAVSLAQTEGVAHTLAEGAAGIDTDSQGAAVQWLETRTPTIFQRT